MRVSTSTHVVSHDVSSGLKFLADELDQPEFKTTAWFIDQIEEWLLVVLSDFLDVIQQPVLELQPSTSPVEVQEHYVPQLIFGEPENSLKFNLGDLERLAPEEVFNLLDRITEEQALNSDVEGDSDAEDNLVYDTPAVMMITTLTEGSDDDYDSDDSINDPIYEPEESSSRGNISGKYLEICGLGIVAIIPQELNFC
ncbi:hypothetical protein QE152_g9293 [Popillia japonica]|uniref:Uncharacterized protein n=1 Tax=Popillia japonica TaxID=7064 RepID=A0AAW1LZ06_POPJA